MLGIDTSNYTTSMAVLDHKYNLMADERIILEVSKGSRGLRQSDAVFQHIKNIPVLTEKIFSKINREWIQCMSVSSRPRPIENSYMPSFVSGQAIAKTLSSVLNCDYKTFSHQEGHIRAGYLYSEFNMEDEAIVLHLSGGTTELLQVKRINNGYKINIIGGTQDISFGQLIDRIGVQLGCSFPAGKYMDEIAINYIGESTQFLKKIYINDTNINLSGIETQCLRYLAQNVDHHALVNELFIKISDALKLIIVNAVSKIGCKNILLVGGVSSSQMIRSHLKKVLENEDLKLCFSEPSLSTDNAVGIAALAMDQLINNNEQKQGK